MFANEPICGAVTGGVKSKEVPMSAAGAGVISKEVPISVEPLPLNKLDGSPVTAEIIGEGTPVACASMGVGFPVAIDINAGIGFFSTAFAVFVTTSKTGDTTSLTALAIELTAPITIPSPSNYNQEYLMALLEILFFS
jgi:hypothetical protein